MKLRDKLNTVEGYQEIIQKNQENIDNDINRISERTNDENNGIQNFPKTNLEIIKSIKDNFPEKYFKILLATYSQGRPIDEIRDIYLKSIPPFVEVWKKSNGYVKMLQMLSIGILLDVEDSIFNKLSDAVKQDNPQDLILDVLINYRDPSWEKISANVTWAKPYKTLKDVVETVKTDKSKSLNLLMKYLAKDWFKGVEIKTHDSKWNIHYGYWSFESAALVKILGLNDSNLKDLEYYPYDLVHFK